jgi:hypothetical protein
MKLIDVNSSCSSRRRDRFRTRALNVLSAGPKGSGRQEKLRDSLLSGIGTL